MKTDKAQTSAKPTKHLAKAGRLLDKFTRRLESRTVRGATSDEVRAALAADARTLSGVLAALGGG